MIKKAPQIRLYFFIFFLFPILFYSQEDIKVFYEYQKNDQKLEEKIKKDLGRVSYLGSEVFVFFDNSMENEKILMTNHFIVPEISFIVKKNLKYGFGKVYGLQGNSKNWYININSHFLYIDSMTYLKYKFVIIKKLKEKEFKIIFTNHPDYNFSKINFENIIEIPK